MIYPQPKIAREDRVKREPIDWRGFKFPRATTARDKKFTKDAIRTHDCGIRGRTDRTTHLKHKCGPKLDTGKVLLDFAHVPTGGHRTLSRRATDLGGGMVLCRFAHMTQHALGWPSFAERYGIDPKAEAERVAREYTRRTEKP